MSMTLGGRRAAAARTSSAAVARLITRDPNDARSARLATGGSKSARSSGANASGHPDESSAGYRLPRRRSDRPVRAFGHAAIRAAIEVRGVCVMPDQRPDNDRGDRDRAQMRPTARPRRADQRNDSQNVQRWNANEADRSRRCHVSANRRPHHPDVADDGEQWIGEETAEDAEQHHVDDGIETAERRDGDEQRRHSPEDKGSSLAATSMRRAAAQARAAKMTSAYEIAASESP